MFEVTLLSTKDKKQWLRILDGFELKDPHYLPGYLEIYEKVSSNRESFMHFGGHGMLFVYGDSRNFIIYPFIKRSISLLPFADNSVKHLYDIISPHGYGGPLAQVEDEAIRGKLWRGFYKEFGAFCRQNKIVSEFSRLHPMFDNIRFVSEFSDGLVEKKGRIVYCDLTGSEEDILAHMSRQRRWGVRKAAQNGGLNIHITSDMEYIKMFCTLYRETMIRNEAHKRYLFPCDFFESIFKVLDNHILMCCITHEGELISAAIILCFDSIAYDWLSCSRAEFLSLCPNDICIYQTALAARKNGHKYLVLGGGSSGEDSLFKFKAEFSGLFKDFYVYKKIHLEDEYNELVRLRNGYTKEPAGDFFPEYRSYRSRVHQDYEMGR